MIRRRACSSNAAELIYTTRPPATARSSRAMRLRPTRAPFLFKNLNVAPSANGLQPYTHFVIQLLFNDILSYSIRHFSERRYRIHAASPRLGYENVVIVFADILIRRGKELSKSYIEVPRRSHPSQDGVVKSAG